MPVLCEIFHASTVQELLPKLALFVPLVSGDNITAHFLGMPVAAQTISTLTFLLSSTSSEIKNKPQDLHHTQSQNVLISKQFAEANQSRLYYVLA